MDRPNWYLKDVKEKEKRDWTIKEMKTIYTLRNSHDIAPIKIARMFDATITQIHNVTRLARKAYKRKCFICGHDLSKTDLKKYKGKFLKACTKCRKKQTEYKKEIRERFLKNGKCGYCGKREVIPGHTACKKCISASYRRRYKKMICGRCGKNPICTERSIALCETCLDKQK